MTTVHRVVRPLWMCAVDGFPWPCLEARQLLRELCVDDPSVMQRHMAQLMAVAEHEIGVLDRMTLYRRFVAWTLDDGQRCVVCGSLRHAVIPGVPPRLVPCNEVQQRLTDEAARVRVDG
jgi:hypothetical protein